MLCPRCLCAMFVISLQLADGEYRFGQCPHGHVEGWEHEGRPVHIGDVLGTLAAEAGGVAVPRERCRAPARQRRERKLRVVLGCGPAARRLRSWVRCGRCHAEPVRAGAPTAALTRYRAVAPTRLGPGTSGLGVAEYTGRAALA